MNRQFSRLALALLLASTSSTFAASRTDLTVTGLITPTACEPTLTDGGIVDYAKIPVKDLNTSGPTLLETKTLQLTVSCNGPASFAISALDNRANTSHYDSALHYGLGKINETEKLGGYSMELRDLVADVPVTPLNSRDEGATWTVGDGLFDKRDWKGFGTRTGGNWAPVALQSLAANLFVTAYIAPIDGLTLTNEVKLDGAATLQIEYL